MGTFTVDAQDNPLLNVDPRQNVIRIVEELKEDAAQRKRLVGILFPDESTVEDEATETTGEISFQQAAESLELEPPLSDKNQTEYELRDLLFYDDRQFVYNAYRVLLKRPPDETGLTNAVQQLRRGALDKLDILADLYSSEERKVKGVHVRGLRFQAMVRRIVHIPILRLLAAPIYHLIRLPSVTREQQRSRGTIFRRQETIARYVNDNVPDQVRSLANVVEKMVRLLEEQKKTQKVLLERVEKLASYCEERLNEEAMQRRQGVRDRELEIEDVRRVYNKYRTQVELTEKALKQQMEHLFRKHQEVKMELVFQGQRLGSLTEPRTPPDVETRADANAGHSNLDAFFAAFDEHFRGDREAVKQRLRQYLPIIREHGVGTAEAPVVDVACGRGEWLELLKEEKLHASGVDINQVLLQQCQDLGLEVRRAELTDYLHSLAENSVGAVSAFHIVEHLEIEALISFLDQALRVIRPGGLLLIETPNPENVLVGSCNFYFDPTHRNPIPKPVLKFLVESRGFVIVEILALNPSDEQPVAADSEMAKRFNQFFYGPMDYAIIARKL